MATTPESLVVLLCLFTLACIQASAIEDKTFWMADGQAALKKTLALRDSWKKAKNVILFLGDGMGISTVTASRIYKGQKAGQTGEEYKLNFEQFPNVAFSKTYAVDRQTSGSASTGSAIVSGVKVNFGTVGFDARVKRRNCSLVSDPAVRLTTILDWSLAAGKSAGIVTTARVTHASPAATYAHSPDRNWERYSDVKGNPPECTPDIAVQLIRNNSNINVIMGGGRRNFIPDSRGDNLDLLQEWRQIKINEGKNATSKYITTAQELRNLNVDNTDYLLGLFADNHMDFELHRNSSQQPSITEMTLKAIEVMKKNSKGYFLFVEGARIDHGHHDNWAKRALEDAVAMDNAVGAAKDAVGDDTLIVVTADHSHPFNIVGYPGRGNPILGLVNPVDPGQEPTDGKPYSTLVYADGPGIGRDVNLTTVNMSADDFRFPRLVPMQAEWETHGGEDVGIFAWGPMSHLFTGVQEQNYIAHALGYASCVGPNTDFCDNPPPDPTTCGTPGLTLTWTLTLASLLLTFRLL